MAPRSRTALARDLRAPVLEVFASFQGEGRYVGEPQVFVRLAGCPLRCRWCDTPGSWRLSPDARARLDLPDGPRRVEAWAEPDSVAEWVRAVERGPARTVSVTGGEPLLWPGFVSALRGGLAPRRIHLETAGAHPDALRDVLDAVDHVSLDLKLPADLDEPELVPESPGAVPRDGSEWSAVRRRVLGLVRGRDACAKVLVAGNRSPDDFLPLLDDVAALAPELPLVVQPVTAMHGVPAPSRALLAGVADAALARGLEVRVIPQVHRVLGVP